MDAADGPEARDSPGGRAHGQFFRNCVKRRVYIVGAGPGDPLITVSGLSPNNAIKSAVFLSASRPPGASAHVKTAPVAALSLPRVDVFHLYAEGAFYCQL